MIPEASWERIKEYGWHGGKPFADIIESWSEGELRKGLKKRKARFNELSEEILERKRKREHLDQEINAIKDRLEEVT